ncbi:MAG: hypothetical protein VX950_04070 [Pseudomonadota bacterium]|nr:hypothetical protein [Pseudomonadota bacterium]
MAAITEFDAVAPAYVQTAAIRPHYERLKPMASAMDREGVAFLILTGAYLGFFADALCRSLDGVWADAPFGPMSYGFDTDYYSVISTAGTLNLVLKRYLNELGALLGDESM